MTPKHSGAMAMLLAMGKPKGPPDQDTGPMAENPATDTTDDVDNSADPDQGADESGPYDIPLPKGFQAPDGVEAGQKFDLTIKAHLSDDGNSLCIDDIGGIPTSGDEAENAEDANEGEQDTEEDSSPVGDGGEEDSGGENEGEPSAQGGPPMMPPMPKKKMKVAAHRRGGMVGHGHENVQVAGGKVQSNLNKGMDNMQGGPDGFRRGGMISKGKSKMMGKSAMDDLKDRMRAMANHKGRYS